MAFKFLSPSTQWHLGRFGKIQYLRLPSFVSGSQEAANSSIWSLVTGIDPNGIHTGSKEPVTVNLYM